MLGFEQILLQIATVTNGTTAEIAGDAFINSVNSLIGTITALIGSVAGIVIAIIAARSAGRARTKQEEQAIGTAEAFQIVMQKMKEDTALRGVVGKALLQVATTDEQRQYLDREVAPVVNVTGERISTIDQQMPAITELIGVKTANVSTKSIPRESDATLATVNEAVKKEAATV